MLRQRPGFELAKQHSRTPPLTYSNRLRSTANQPMALSISEANVGSMTSSRARQPESTSSLAVSAHASTALRSSSSVRVHAEQLAEVALPDGGTASELSVIGWVRAVTPPAP